MRLLSVRGIVYEFYAAYLKGEQEGVTVILLLVLLASVVFF